jgi:cytoskeletal protein CcmA (bactofilin family)
MTSNRARTLLLPAVFLLATFAIAQDNGREFHWSGKLADNNIVEIKNINGWIEAGPATGDQVEVSAEKSGPDADQVKIQVVPSSDGVTICAIYPHASTTCEPGESWHVNNVHGDRTKVNFTVKLPNNLRFSGQSINGEVKAEELGRFVRATSVNGSVHVSTKSWAEAETVNGSVEVAMGSADWNGKLKIETVNGSITLKMPDDFNADVSFRSVNGNLTTDFPLTVKGTMGGWGSHRADGRIGNGGRDLQVETVNGSVRLEKGAGSL